MARLAQIPTPVSKPVGTTASLGATTASAITTPGKGVVILIATAVPLTITFGPSGTVGGTPSTTVGAFIPANTSQIFDLDQNDSFQVFNTSAAPGLWGFTQIKAI